MREAVTELIVGLAISLALFDFLAAFSYPLCHVLRPDRQTRRADFEPKQR